MKMAFPCLEASQSSVVASSTNIRLNDWNQPDDDDDGFGKTMMLINDDDGDDDAGDESPPTRSSGRPWRTWQDLELLLQRQQC